MKKEQFYNFEGEDTFLEFTGEEENEFDEFVGKKAKQKRKSKKTPEELEAIRVKSEMIATFKKEFLALGYSDFKSGALARKKYKEWLQQQPQTTINFFGLIDDEEENEFDEFLGKRAKKKNTMGSSARRSKKTPEELEVIRLKSEMIRAFMKEGLALGYSKRDAKAFAIKKYNEYLQQQPQSTINFFGLIDEEENEFDEFVGATIAAVKAGKRLKELTNAEEARMAQIEQDLRNSGALPGVAKIKSRATILVEIQRRKNDEVDRLKKDLIAAKKANRANAGFRAKRLWEDARKKQLEQESLAGGEAYAQNVSQVAQPGGLGEIGNVKLPKTPTGFIKKSLADKLKSMKFATKEDRDAYIASQTQGQTKNLNAGALPESPVADVADESTSTMVTPTVGTNTNEGSEKPNYMLWTGIGLAVLTLGFLAYRKYYAK
jgi:hypothetical protein